MKKIIRVLCVFSTLDRGGAETMCMNLYRNIDRNKVQFDFVKHTSKKGAYEDEIVSLGGRIYEAPRYKIYNHFKYCSWWKRHLMNHNEHQIIHGHFFTISAVYFKVAQKYGRITIGHSHCTPSDSKFARKTVSNFYVSKICKYSSYRFACSIPAGNWIFNKSFIVLNNAIDTSQFSYNPIVRNQLRKQLGLENRFVLGTVGRIEHQKNPSGIIEIFKAVHSKRKDAFLIWVGDGPSREKAERRIEELGLKENVFFTGVISDVYRIMQAMDAFIFPSFFEGLGVAAIEAQASGLPCYVSDKVPIEVKVTDNCYFLPLDKVDIWAEHLCLKQPDRKDQRESLIEAGYDVRFIAKWLCYFYKSIVPMS